MDDQPARGRRRRGLLIAVAAVVALAGVGIGVAWWPQVGHSPTGTEWQGNEPDSPRSLMVSGGFTSDGSGPPQVEKPLHVSPLNWTPDSVGEGDARILVFAGGFLVGERRFELLFQNPVASAGRQRGTEGEEVSAYYVEAVAVSTSHYTRIELWDGGKLLTSVEASDHEPRVLEATATVDADAGLLRVDWRGEDADGDPLRASVWVSDDDWLTSDSITFGNPDNAITQELLYLESQGDMQVRVQLTDGVLVSAPFDVGGGTLPMGVPEILWISGFNPVGFASAGNAVWAEVEAVDAQEQLWETPDAFVWYSHRTGEVGRGRELFFNATEMPEGFHIMTVVITDSDGGSNSWAGLMYIQHAWESEGVPELTDDDVLGLAAEAVAALSLEDAIRAELGAALDGLRGGGCTATGDLDDAVARAADAPGTTPVDAALLRALDGLVLRELGCAPADPWEEEYPGEEEYGGEEDVRPD